MNRLAIGVMFAASLIIAAPAVGAGLSVKDLDHWARLIEKYCEAEQTVKQLQSLVSDAARIACVDMEAKDLCVAASVIPGSISQMQVQVHGTCEMLAEVKQMRQDAADE